MSRNLCALPQDTKLPDSTHSSYFQWQSKFVDPIILSCSFYHQFHVHRPDIAEKLLFGRKTPTINHSINQSNNNTFEISFYCLIVFVNFVLRKNNQGNQDSSGNENNAIQGQIRDMKNRQKQQ